MNIHQKQQRRGENYFIRIVEFVIHIHFYFIFLDPVGSLVSTLWVVGWLVGHSISKLVNFECVGILECVGVLVCFSVGMWWCVGVLVPSVPWKP